MVPTFSRSSQDSPAYYCTAHLVNCAFDQNAASLISLSKAVSSAREPVSNVQCTSSREPVLKKENPLLTGNRAQFPEQFRISRAIQHGNPWVSKQLIPYNQLSGSHPSFQIFQQPSLLSFIIITRSSADADNRLDAFISGQSSPCHKWRHTYLTTYGTWHWASHVAVAITFNAQASSLKTSLCLTYN